MAGVIIYMLTFERMPQLDGLAVRRCSTPAEYMIRATAVRISTPACSWRASTMRTPSMATACIKWDAKVRAPITRAVSSNGTRAPVTRSRAGHPCLGCSEENFWDNSPFYKRMPDIHGFGIEATADQIGLALGAATAAGIAVHA